MRLLLCLLAILSLASCAQSERRGPVILAASSLQEPLEQLADAWQAAGHDRPVLSFASSAALARQVENGSPADIFISADRQWTDYLVAAGNIDADHTATIAKNALVVAVHAEDERAVIYESDPPLRTLLAKGSVGTGDPDSVPLGRYAKEALEAAGIWEGTRTRLIGAPSSQAAVALLLKREVDSAILYRSDVLRRDELFSLATIPASYHSPIDYEAVILAGSAHPQTSEFFAYLASGKARSAFSSKGFGEP